MNRQSIFLAPFLLLAPFALAHAESLDIKPGLWQITVTASNLTAMIPPEAIANLPPQMRDQVMARMQQASHPQTHQTCMTQEKIQKGIDLTNQTHGDCTELKVNQTSRSIEVTAQCQKNGNGAQMHMLYTALNRETIHGTMELTRADGSHPTHIQMDGKFVSDSCAGSEDSK